MADGEECSSIGCKLRSELAKIAAGTVLSAMESPWRWAVFFYLASLLLACAHAMISTPPGQSVNLTWVGQLEFQAAILILSIIFAIAVHLGMKFLAASMDKETLAATIASPIEQWYGMTLFSIVVLNPIWIVVVAALFVGLAYVFIGGYKASALALLVATPMYWLGTLTSAGFSLLLFNMLGRGSTPQATTEKQQRPG